MLLCCDDVLDDYDYYYYYVAVRSLVATNSTILFIHYSTRVVDGNDDERRWDVISNGWILPSLRRVPVVSTFDEFFQRLESSSRVEESCRVARGRSGLSAMAGSLVAAE